MSYFAKERMMIVNVSVSDRLSMCVCVCGSRTGVKERERAEWCTCHRQRESMRGSRTGVREREKKGFARNAKPHPGNG